MRFTHSVRPRTERHSWRVIHKPRKLSNACFENATNRKCGAGAFFRLPFPDKGLSERHDMPEFALCQTLHLAIRLPAQRIAHRAYKPTMQFHVNMAGRECHRYRASQRLVD